MNFLNDKRIIFGVISVLGIISIIGIGLSMYFYQYKGDVKSDESNIGLIEEEKKEETSNKEVWYVEVKGAVKKPGVFEVNSENIINDVIKKAGGFKSNAYSNNINLSKKVRNEMVVYVYTKSGYKKKNEVKSEECICNEYEISDCLDSNASIIVNGNSSIKYEKEDSNSTEESETNNLININTASLSELATLPGLGESKAQAIIDYRNQFGNFKKVEDIKNVSGIGDKTYEKFKGSITV